MDPVVMKAARDQMNRRGVDAVYHPAPGEPVPCKIRIIHDSELRPSGDLEIGVIMVGTVIQALCEDVGRPRSGSTFLADGETYTVARLDSTDRIFTKVVIREG